MKTIKEILFFSGIVSELLLGTVLVFYFKRLPPEVPFLFSIPWGETQLVPWWIVVVVFILGICFLLVNLKISSWIESKELLLGRLFMAGGTLMVILFATSATKIVLLTHF